jgi:hypothetical protein
MADWTNIPDATFDPDRPVLGSTHLAIVKNFTALAEGATGAPRVETAAIASNEQMTTANVLGATAGGAAGAVGTYVLGRRNATGNIAFGATVAGSSLLPISAAAGINTASGNAGTFAGGAALTGTWRAMGEYVHAKGTAGGTEADLFGATLWLRIS